MLVKYDRELKIITGKGNNRGEVRKTFTIEPVSLSNATINVSEAAYDKDGMAKMSIKVLLNGMTLNLDKDYSIEYQNNSKGTSGIKVSGKGNYSGTVSKEIVLDGKGIGKCQPTEKSIIISAQSDKCVEVTVKEEDKTQEEEEEIDENVEDLLRIDSDEFEIKRDYNQACMIEVYNDSNKTQEFYLKARNRYRDLSMEIIKSGSAASPLLIKPGERLKVELSVFAQNAEQKDYRIPITAYVLTEGEYKPGSRENITIICPLPNLDLSWTKISEDESTLRQKYRLKNNGDTLTDLKISASDSLKDCVMFSPIISNYILDKGESVEFAVQPDLTKMKDQNISVLEGELTAECAGQSSSYKCVFDTKGQEITTTTMGELALKQEGNPYSKFEVVEDSIKVQYMKDGKYVDYSGDGAIEDFVDEKGCVDYKLTSDFDLGENYRLIFESGIKSSIFQGSNEEERLILNETPVVERKDGYIQIKVRDVVTSDQYKKITDDKVSNVSRDKANYKLLKSGYLLKNSPIDDIEDPYEEGEKFLLESSFLIKGSTGILDKNPEMDFFDSLGAVYDIVSILDESVDTWGICHDPRVSNDDKYLYTCLHIGRTAMHLVSIAMTLTPIAGPAGFLLSADLYLIDKLFEGFESGIINKYKNMSAITDQIQGEQCTNRRRIDVDFYVPDYRRRRLKDNNQKEDTNPKMKVTSRMKPGDGWVDETERDYDVELNGDSVGTVGNDGVTDVVISDIPTNNLKPGERNHLGFDYHTSPGSHHVTTDTRITILYPSDTDISYIGEPKNLQNVRLMPDFEVNPENIFTEGDLIANEKAILKCNVYNLGSCGGWFNIIVMDGQTVIYKETNRYMDAFTKETIQMDWIPKASGNQITVSITNTTVGLEEYKDSNNTATKTFQTRQREIPEFSLINTSAIYEEMPYSLNLDVKNSTDLTNISFYMDNVMIDNGVLSSGYGNEIHYCLSSERGGLSAGKHTLKVVAKYNTSNGIGTKSKEYTLDVLEKITEIPKIEVISSKTLMYGEKIRLEIYNAVNLLKTSVMVDNESETFLSPMESEEDYYSYVISANGWQSGNH